MYETVFQANLLTKNYDQHTKLNGFFRKCLLVISSTCNLRIVYEIIYKAKSVRSYHNLLYIFERIGLRS